MKRKNNILVAVLAAVSVLAIGAFAVSEAHESSKQRYGATGGYMSGPMGGNMGGNMGGHMGGRMGGHMGMGNFQMNMGGQMGMGGGHGPSAAMWDHMDTNKDGTITKEEISKLQRDQIAKFDTNGDGKLSLGEFQGLWTDRMKERIVDHFQAIDNNGDATVTLEEISRLTGRMTTMFDRNGDGTITTEEMRGGHRGFGAQDDHDDDDDDKRKGR